MPALLSASAISPSPTPEPVRCATYAVQMTLTASLAAREQCDQSLLPYRAAFRAASASAARSRVGVDLIRVVERGADRI